MGLLRICLENSKKLSTNDIIKEQNSKLDTDFELVMVTPSLAEKMVKLKEIGSKESEFISSSSLELELITIKKCNDLGGFYLVLLHKNVPIGSVICEQQTNRLNLPTMYIRKLMVLKQYGNRGFGTFLLSTAQVLTLSKGIDFISLSVYDNNPAAIALYKKLGYIETKKVTYFDMEKKIN